MINSESRDVVLNVSSRSRHPKRLYMSASYVSFTTLAQRTRQSGPGRVRMVFPFRAGPYTATNCQRSFNFHQRSVHSRRLLASGVSDLTELAGL